MAKNGRHSVIGREEKEANSEDEETEKIGVCGGVWMIVENDSSKSESFGGFIPVIAKSASAVTPSSD
ncbi:hypothetical protein C5167_007981 [Papaver somniferum]|uniref:Uncharacterized protein n=1 Tax=Papaver somniferum TaxID=3469 RepID=A0A4Y7JX39_PAPSO|nr:hypothetical protein C5167_007981 [Papaver somniferum]